jgi:hypothetical protein
VADDDRIEQLANRFTTLSDDEAAAAMADLTPDDRAALQERLLLEVTHATVMTGLMGIMAAGAGQGTAPSDPLHGVETEMATEAAETFSALAWKMVRHAHGRELTADELGASLKQLAEEDPEVLELLKSAATYMQWYGAEGE